MTSDEIPQKKSQYRDPATCSRSVRFITEFARRRAQEIVEFPGGFVVLDPRHPQSYDHNKLFVTGTPTSADIVQAADTILGRAGLDHRMVVIADDEHGLLCANDLSAAGYRHDVNLVMRHVGEPGSGMPTDADLAGGTAPLVTTVELSDLAEPDRRSWYQRFPQASAETIRQLVERRAILHRGAEAVTFLGSRDQDGVVVCHADLYRSGRTAQIEDLCTAETHTNQGYARAVLRHALAKASAAGCDLVFLVADADDWPQTWYQRLGFRTIARYHEFVRPASSP